LGMGDGGWETADSPKPPIPYPQSPIPNPQSPIPIKLIYSLNIFPLNILDLNKNKIILLYKIYLKNEC